MKNSGVQWIGLIPDDWEIGKVKYLFTRKNEKAEQENPVILTLARTGVKIRDLSNNEGQWAENYFNYNPVVPGDLLLNPMDLYSGANCSLSKVSGVISPAYINLKIKDDNNPGFFDYYFKIQYWSMAFFAHGKGVSFDNRWTLNTETLMNYPIIIPPKDVQNKIADFLDKKCSEIQSAIDNTKQTIEEYKKLKQAVITKAVTKGIRENRKLKDSGSVWFADVPEDWKTKKLKFVFYIKKDIAGKEGYDVLSITQKGIVVKDLSKNEGQLAADYSNYQLVNVGDFAMNHMDLLTGWIDISKYPGVTSPDYRVFQLHEPENNCARYYLYMMQMCYMNRIFYGLGQGVSGMGRWRLQADKFLNFLIVQPSKTEQQEIADYLDKKCSQIDTLISQKEQFITELEKYKQSLIYEYVTGKKEVK